MTMVLWVSVGSIKVINANVPADWLRRGSLVEGTVTFSIFSKLQEPRRIRDIARGFNSSDLIYLIGPAVI